jgi:hypothetical protein
MQTVRDLITYICKETVEYLNRTEKLKHPDIFLKDKLVKKFFADNKLKPYKGKSIVIIRKPKANKPFIIPGLSEFELKICAIICEVHNVDFHDLFSRSRSGMVVDARRQFTAFLYTYLAYTYAHVGFLFGKDHSTIIHNVRTHENLLETDTIYAIKFGKFMDVIKNEFPEILEKVDEKQELFKEYKKVHAQRATNAAKLVSLENKPVKALNT